MQRPPGPPPGAAPLAVMKPPPRAPPPNMLIQEAHRPAVESIAKRSTEHEDTVINTNKASSTDTQVNKSNVSSTSAIQAAKKGGAIAMFEEPLEKEVTERE